MKALLQAELLKLRTTRTFVALVGAALAISLLLLVLSAVFGDFHTAIDVRRLFASDFTGVFILLLGAMGMAGEWRHRTITSTVLAAPDRLRLLGAKALSYVVAGIVVSGAITVTLMLVGTIILSSRGQTTIGASDLIDVLWRKLVVAGYIGAIGVCVGAIVRNQVAAIIGLLIWVLVVESALFAAVPQVEKFAPLSGAPGAVVDISVNGDSIGLLSPAIGGLVMVGWVALLFAAGALLLRKRDLT